MRIRPGLALAMVVMLASWASAAQAGDIETRGAYCNDNYFSSDGAGITGCINLAVHFGADTAGIGVVGATPEQKHVTKKTGSKDPLDSLGRITAWYGREFNFSNIHFALDGRIGIEGGVADDVALAEHNFFHALFQTQSKKLKSNHDTTVIGGLSGWARRDFILDHPGGWAVDLAPFALGALGNDNIEAEGGVVLGLQPPGEMKGLALLTPLNGAYAPTFGGDGIGLFADARGVARDTLYGAHANPFIAEAGVVAQVTLWKVAVFGASASCTTEPYHGAGKADCKATLQAGGHF